MKSTGGATATVVTTYTMENANRGGLAPDGNGGLYEFVGGNQAGIYDAPVTTGVQTGVDTAAGSLTLGGIIGPLHAADSGHVYYATVSNSMFSLWSHAK